MYVGKYYAVKSGDKLIIFDDWNACRSHIDSVDSSIIKSFEMEDDARAWLRENQPATSSEKSIITKEKSTDNIGYYAVAPGHTSGIYRSYDCARTAADRCPGANIKFMYMYSHAEIWIRTVSAATAKCNCIDSASD